MAFTLASLAGLFIVGILGLAVLVSMVIDAPTGKAAVLLGGVGIVTGIAVWAVNL